MARPIKEGLEYFPLDVSNDDKLDLIEAEFGLTGFAVIIKLWQTIYRNNYYYNFGEPEQLLFSKRVSVDRNEVIAIINSATRWKLFDKNIFEKYKILTSTGIQKRYFGSINRRTNISVVKELLLIDLSEYKAFQYVSINLINDDINPVNADENSSQTELMSAKSTQRKVKESKEKKSKKMRAPAREENFPFSGCSEKFNTIFESYLDMRKKIKKPATDKAIDLAYQHLQKLAPGNEEKQIKILEQSILNSWQGLFELKEDSKAGNQKSANPQPAPKIEPWRTFKSLQYLSAYFDRLQKQGYQYEFLKDIPPAVAKLLRDYCSRITHEKSPDYVPEEEFELKFEKLKILFEQQMCETGHENCA